VGIKLRNITEITQSYALYVYIVWYPLPIIAFIKPTCFLNSQWSVTSYEYDTILHVYI